MAGVLSPLISEQKGERDEQQALPFTYSCFLLCSISQNQVKASHFLLQGSGPLACLLQSNTNVPHDQGLPGSGAKEGCPLTSATETPSMGMQPPQVLWGTTVLPYLKCMPWTVAATPGHRLSGSAVSAFQGGRSVPNPICSPCLKSWLMEEYSRAGFGSCCAFSSVPIMEMRAIAARKVAARREGWIEHRCYQHPCKLFLKQYLKHINYPGALESKLWERKRNRVA